MNLLDKYMDLFQGRPDAHAEQYPDGTYRLRKRPMQREDYLAHLRRMATYGIYLLRDDGKVKLACVDIDTNSEADLKEVLDRFRALGVTNEQLLVEFSGRKGWHVWVFFSDWVPAAQARALGLAVTDGKFEVFPKQDSLGQGRPYGNLVKLPFGMHQASGRASVLVREYGTATLGSVQPIPAETLPSLIPPLTRSRRTPSTARLRPCMQHLLAEGVARGARDMALFALALDAKRAGFSEDEAIDLVTEAARKCAPPLGEREAEEKVHSAYTHGYGGLDCRKEYLHVGEPLCSTACPIYRPELGRARPQSWKSGDILQLRVERVYPSGDGTLWLIASHPLAKKEITIRMEVRDATQESDLR